MLLPKMVTAFPSYTIFSDTWLNTLLVFDTLNCIHTCIHYALCVRNLLHRNLDPMTWCSMCWRQAMSHPGTGPACESTMFRRAARNSICFSANYAPIMHPYDQVFTPRRSAGGGLCAGSTHWGREEGPKNWYSMQEMNALHHAVNWH